MGGGGETASHSIFGNIVQSHLNFDYTAMMVTFIICFVIFVEKIFEFLKSLTNDTPFNKVLPSIERELMVVGFTAFVFKIYLNASNHSIRTEIYEALEFADTLVPFFSFTSCILGLILIYVSVKLCENWSKGYHSNSYVLINEFFIHYYSWSYWCIPPIVNGTIARLEFKILHNVFCEMFQLKLTSFAFDEYVEIVFERFTKKLVHTDPVHWLLFFSLLIAEWARSKFQVRISACSYSDDMVTLDCMCLRSTHTFLIAGACLYGITWVFLIVSRYYVLRLIRKKGIMSIEFYPAYIYYIEKLQEAGSQSAVNIRKDEDDLKKSVSAAIKTADLIKKRRSNSQHIFPSWFGGRESENQHSSRKKNRKRSMKTHTEEADPTTVNDNSNLNIANENKDLNLQNSDDAILEEGSANGSNNSSSNNLNPNKKLAYFMTSGKHSTALQGQMEPHIAAVSMGSILHSMYLPSPVPRADGADQNKRYHENKEKPLFEMDERIENGEITARDATNASINGKHPYPQDDTDELVHSLHSVDDLGLHSTPANRKLPRHVSGKFSPTGQPTGSASEEKPNLTAENAESSLKDSFDESAALGSTLASSARNEDNSARKVDSSLRKDTSNHNTSAHRRSSVSTFNFSFWETRVDHFKQREVKEGSDSNIFFLSRPYLYFEGIKLLLMLIALYTSLWLIQYLPADCIGGVWKFLSFLPVVLSCINFALVVKFAVLLKAVHKIDRESMLEVVEQTEGARNLEDLIRTRLLERLCEMESDEGGGHPERELETLFHEIDVDNDGFLSRNELTKFLHSLDIYFSRRKWQQIFRQMDKNQESPKLISLSEFSLFVFPDHSTALSEETQRLKAVKDEAKRQSLKFAPILEKKLEMKYNRRKKEAQLDQV